MEQGVHSIWWLPIDISTHGAAIDSMMVIIHVFMAILFVAWGIFFVYALLRFRARDGHTAVYEPIKGKLAKSAEIGVVIFEAFLLVGLSMPVWAEYKTISPEMEKEAVHIRVVAQQFAWNIHYPGSDGKFGRTAPEFMEPGNFVGIDPADAYGQDDVVPAQNQLRVPVDTPIIVHLTSKDVIHSFGVPVLRVKQDMIPGMTIPIHFQATRTGRYEIACSQLCGITHYNMRGFLTVLEKDEFQQWMAEQKN